MEGSDLGQRRCQKSVFPRAVVVKRVREALYGRLDARRREVVPEATTELVRHKRRIQ